MKGDSLRVHSPRLQNGHFRSLMTYEGIKRGGLLPDFTLQRKNSAEDKWQMVAILDAKYRKLEGIMGKWLPRSEEVTQMALYTCNASQEEDPVPCALIYPRVVASGSISGINTAVDNMSGYPVGKAKLHISGQPMLSWWVIGLNELDNRRDWIEEVDEQLKSIIDHLLVA